MEEPNVLNIPAYQRKRSINAKARKKPSYLETALDRMERANMRRSRAAQAPHATKSRSASPPKRSSKKKSKKHTISKRSKLQSSRLTTVEEIPIQTILPSREIFPDPFLMEELPKKQNNFREMLSCGICEGYFDKIEVAIIKVTSPLRIGDSIIFEKQDGLFEQEIKSMQLNRKDITLATTGSEIGLKVYQKPTVGSPIYKVIE